ncbi:MAG: hypothetical protein IT204_09895 [Fimbriimonadaceae bacterium]|nr:hypothetical protein [Fimbriimonadaceae bacterium]
MNATQGPVLLVIFDGWGYRSEPFGNAIHSAEVPNWDQLWEAYPHALLAASGPAVGLSDGTVGSAAAGFATLAAGRPVEQPPLLLDRAHAEGSFAASPVFADLARRVRETPARLHLLGMVSDGQVVSAERHYFALLHLLAAAGVPGQKVLVHGILDGYDTPPKSGIHYLARLTAEMMRTGVGRVATLLGRNWGMAQTGGWEATERAWAALVNGVGRLVPSAIQAIQAGYSRGEDDITLSPAVMLGTDGLPLGRLADGDLVLCFNHREEGLERLLRALLQDGFRGFGRERPLAIEAVSLTGYRYGPELGLTAACASPERPPGLGALLAAAGKRVALVGESLMESHLRLLVSGARAERVDWRLIPSPPLHQTCEQPARATEAITAAAVELLTAADHELIVADYVTADLVGHCGQAGPAQQAIEALDSALSPLVRSARRAGATMLLTACYGNVEELELSHGARPNPAHTANPVPFILIDDRLKGYRIPRLPQAGLADVTATVLALLQVPPAPDMTGRDLSANLRPATAPSAAVEGPLPLELAAPEAIAMVLEASRSTRDYYQHAATAADDSDSAALYRVLRSEEDRRLRDLQRRLDLLAPESAAPSPEPEPPVEPPDPGLPPLEVLDAALREELETYRVLTEMAARNVDAEGRAALEEIAAEELELLDRLRRLSESEAIRVLTAVLPTSSA